MKNASIFLWLLLPMLLGVLLLPPLSFWVFRTQAEKQAATMAERDLKALQQQIAELAAETLPETVTARGNRIQPFLRSVSGVISKANGSARLLLYADENKLIYPMEEESFGVATLASAVADMLGQQQIDTVLHLEADGTAYLVCISPSPVQTKRLTYLVTYCPIASIGTWVDNAGRIVLLLSLGVSLIFGLVMLLLARLLTRSLRAVEGAAAEIRKKRFVTIKKTFPTRELESLRVSVNAMSKQLKNADRKEKAFFQNVSHELRTPLMSIGGYAQGIEQGVFADDKEAAGVIMAESQRLTEMVQGLLDLSKMDREDDPPSFSDVSLTALLDGAADRIAGVALQHDIRLVTKDDTEGVRLTTDEKRVGLILDNLLSNAVRYAKTTVKISAAPLQDSVVLTVKDDGDGIAAEDLPYIFDRCYLGKGGHNGVGLALAKAAADFIGAELKAENGPDGAIFQLILKRH